MADKNSSGVGRSPLSELVELDGIADLFRSLPEVHFFAKDQEGVFIAANAPSLLRNGLHREEEIVGKTDFDFHPPELAAGYRSEDRQVMDSRQPLLNQVWLVYDYLKVQQWFVSSKIPLVNHQGTVVGVAGAMRSLADSDQPSVYQPFNRAINCVLERYDQKLRVSELAKMSSLSVSQFERRFHKIFRMSPTQYILRVRINAARNRLSQSHASIGDIALQCGFYDQAQLSRYFKKLTGMTPSDYRKVFGDVGTK